MNVPLHRFACGLPAAASGHAAHRRGAFTVLEIMLAITIFSGVLTAIYASWTSIMRSTQVGLQSATERQRSRVAVRAIEEALYATQMFQSALNYYSFEADTSEDYAALSVAARLSKSFPGSGMFDDQVVRRVSFFVEPGTNGLNQLSMTQTPLLAALDKKEEPYKIVVAQDVSLFALEFWDGRSTKWLTEWRSTNSLPKLVRISLGIGRSSVSSREPRDFVARTIAMPSVMVRREYQAGTTQGQPGQPGQPGAPGTPGQPGAVGPAVSPGVRPPGR